MTGVPCTQQCAMRVQLAIVAGDMRLCRYMSAMSRVVFPNGATAVNNLLKCNSVTNFGGNVDVETVFRDALQTATYATLSRTVTNMARGNMPPHDYIIANLQLMLGFVDNTEGRMGFQLIVPKFVEQLAAVAWQDVFESRTVEQMWEFIEEIASTMACMDMLQASEWRSTVHPERWMPRIVQSIVAVLEDPKEQAEAVQRLGVFMSPEDKVAIEETLRDKATAVYTLVEGVLAGCANGACAHMDGIQTDAMHNLAESKQADAGFLAALSGTLKGDEKQIMICDAFEAMLSHYDKPHMSMLIRAMWILVFADNGLYEKGMHHKSAMRKTSKSFAGCEKVAADFAKFVQFAESTTRVGADS